MSIRHGQFLTVADSFLVERIQTGGPGNLNQPTEKIRELGNFQTVATIRDIPDLSYDIESLDVTTDFEAMLLRKTPSSIIDGQELKFTSALPIDIISPFKATNSTFGIVSGIAVPSLVVESATYRFGTRANAQQSFTMKGDSVFYIPGTPYYAEYPLAGVGPYTVTPAALPYVQGADTIHVLSLCWFKVSTNQYGRLYYTQDYTDTTTAFTLTASGLASIPSGATIAAVYGSTTAATYNQAVHTEASATNPAAVRGRDIDVYIDGERFTRVQSAEVSWRVNLQAEEEFGNEHYVSQDYDETDVTGSIVIRPASPEEMITRVQQVTNVPSGEVAGTLSSTPVELDIIIRSPDTGDVLKTLFVEDARFLPPPIQGRVNQRIDLTLSFTSDGGNLSVFKGERP